ncbi:uncharacterized protein isoform X5 [Danio rerio]|uniref:Uncharacterized protein isoform X5 n=3 Tax=Danio rerio TaxID=7955 RepID=A0AC58GCB4_DANRE
MVWLKLKHSGDQCCEQQLGVYSASGVHVDPKSAASASADTHAAAGLRQRCTVNKRRAHRCSNSTLEGAGGSRWVGIAFNPIPKPSTHSLSRSFPFRDSGRLNGKLPSLSTQHPKPKHSSGHSSTLSLSLASVKCWRGS